MGGSDLDVNYIRRFLSETELEHRRILGPRSDEDMCTSIGLSVGLLVFMSRDVLV